jgi:TolB protein
MASWSPDGTSIVFQRVSDKGIALMVMSSEGEELREVLADGNFNVHASWSPDSKNLVFHSNAGGAWGIWMLRLGSKNPMRLTSGAGTTLQPAVSRNGQILYGTWSRQTDLYIRKLESGEERRLTAHTEDNDLPRFSPDGEKIIYDSSRTGNREIFLLDIESAEEKQLTDHQDYDGNGDWSPDGREIAFASTRPAGEDKDGDQRLWIMPAEGGVPQLLHKKTVIGPVLWSPEGSLIGFRSQGEDGPELWILNRDDGSVRKVLDHVDRYGWYRDKRHVIVTRRESSGSGEMQAVDLETGEYTVLLEDPHTELVVAPDGSAVSYSSAASHYDMNLHVLKLAEGADGLPRPMGEVVQITHGKGEWHVHNGDWSPYGSQVVYTRTTNAGNLYLLEGVFGGKD